jgi:hypothetical protein
LDDGLTVAAVATAVAAVAPPTTVTTASATTTPAVTTASAATTPVAAAASATAATFALRAGFVDHQSAAEKFLAVESGDGFFGFGVILNFRETKAARLAGKTIAKQSKRIGLYARFRKKSLHILLCSLER